MMQLKKTVPSKRMLADTERILLQGWHKEAEAAQKEMTTDMLDNLDTSSYFVALQTSPIDLPDELADLTAILKLHMLFKLVNKKPGEMKDLLVNVACEIFRNLALIDELSELESIDLGDHGLSFFEQLATIAVELKAKYQVYAAAVIFGAANVYAKAVVTDYVVPGEFVPDRPGSRRYTEGTTNIKQFLKVGILHRYPGLDGNLLE